MQVKKAYRYKLILTQDQFETFCQWAGSCRYVYNLGLEHRKLNWENFKVSQSYASQCEELTQLKKEKEVEWLKQVPSQCLQQSLKNLDRAYQNFFNGVADYPKFKIKGANDSFRFPQAKQLSVIQKGKKKGYIDLPKVGKVRFISSRKVAFEGRICQITISRDVDQWYASIQCEVEIPDVEVIPDEDLGIDLGVAHSISTSAGEHLDLDLDRIKKVESRIERLQKKLSGQKKFGSNWRKTKFQIGKLYRKIRRIKEDFIQKQTTRLAKSYGGIAVEDLKVKNMTASSKGTKEEPGKNVAQKSGLNRSILRVSFGRITQVLEYKCMWQKRTLHWVAPHYSSCQCSKCGHINVNSRKSQSEFECVECKYRENADLNAAKVIKARAFGSLPWGPGSMPVEKAA